MRISLHQMTTTLDVENNAAIVVAEIERAAAAGVELVCFPEAVNVLCGDQSALRAAIPSEGNCPVLAQALVAARRFGVSVNLGSVLLRLEDGVLVNRSYLIDAQGQVLATYDKVHLFDARLADDSELESALYRPGDAAVLVRTASANLGLTICFDMRFSHLFVALAEAGANIILAPSSFSTVTGPVHWLPLLQARAIETGCFVIAAAQCGQADADLTTYGHSVAISPWGEIMAMAADEPTMLVVDADLKDVDIARGKVPTLALRRLTPVTVLGRQ